MQQLGMFPAHLETFGVQATFEEGVGWRVIVRGRLQGQHWDDAIGESYSRLSDREFADVLIAEVLRVVLGS